MSKVKQMENLYLKIVGICRLQSIALAIDKYWYNSVQFISSVSSNATST